jgi:hypothetical protein
MRDCGVALHPLHREARTMRVRDVVSFATGTTRSGSNRDATHDDTS